MSIDALKIKLAGIHRKVLLERLTKLPEEIRRILESTEKDRDLVLTPDNIMMIVVAIDMERALDTESDANTPLLDAKEKLLSAANQASTALALSESLKSPLPLFGTTLSDGLKNQIQTMLKEYALSEDWEDEDEDEEDEYEDEDPELTNDLFQFHIEIEGSQPPIWRRVVVPDCSLWFLHNIIQELFGWEDCHLHQFTIEKKNYDSLEEDLGFGPPTYDESNFSIAELLDRKRKGKKWEYMYDFGDSWRHTLTFEGKVEADDENLVAKCIDGENAGPLEDCGGIWRYNDMVEALSDPKSMEAREVRESHGRFDPKKLDLKKINKRLKTMSAQRV